MKIEKFASTNDPFPSWTLRMIFDENKPCQFSCLFTEGIHTCYNFIESFIELFGIFCQKKWKFKKLNAFESWKAADCLQPKSNYLHKQSILSNFLCFKGKYDSKKNSFFFFKKNMYIYMF